jgi:hypothetical protein
MQSPTSQMRSAVLGAVASCVREEMDDALELLTDIYAERPEGWGEVAVQLAKECVERLAGAVGRPVSHIAATLSDAADDVRAKWVLQAACAELVGDDLAADVAWDAIERQHGLHNAIASAIAVAGLLHAQASMCGHDVLVLAQGLCLDEALRA